MHITLSGYQPYNIMTEAKDSPCTALLQRTHCAHFTGTVRQYVGRQDSQSTLVQVTGTAQAVCVETGPCTAIHSHWKIAADTKVSFAACYSVVKLAYLSMGILHKQVL